MPAEVLAAVVAAAAGVAAEATAVVRSTADAAGAVAVVVAQEDEGVEQRRTATLAQRGDAFENPWRDPWTGQKTGWRVVALHEVAVELHDGTC